MRSELETSQFQLQHFEPLSHSRLIKNKQGILFLKKAYWQINNELNYSGQDFFCFIVLVIVWSFLSDLFIYFLLYVVVEQNSFLFLNLPIYNFYWEFAFSLHLINVYKKYKKQKKEPVVLQTCNILNH